jgi:RNA recognition motif-containing protein
MRFIHKLEMTISAPPTSGIVDPLVLGSKRVVFVGGLADETTTQLLRAAMIPFGSIKSVDIVRERIHDERLFVSNVCLIF